VDGAAHTGALQGAMPTVAVFGTAIDECYPASHAGMLRQILRHGAAISEYPPGKRGYPSYFPQRNRIISGLCLGTVVVEAPKKSGSLITASLALDQGRDVFVVPGNIDVASCAGSNALLRDGAVAVSHGWDVLSEYTHLFGDKLALREDAEPPLATEPAPAKVAQRPMLPARKPEKKKKPIDNREKVAYSDKNDKLSGLSPDEQKLISGLREGARLVDDVIAEAGIPAGLAKAKLTMLEIKGIVTTLPGGRIALK
jgi:DNA processing protein